MNSSGLGEKPMAAFGQRVMRTLCHITQEISSLNGRC